MSRLTHFGALCIVAFALLLLFFVGIAPAKGQGPGPNEPTAVIYPFVTDSARAQLERAWDDTNPAQVERGYCVTSFDTMESPTENGMPGMNEWIKVTDVVPAITRAAASRSADFACPAGQQTLHTHPPTTCAGDESGCILGGPGAYECAPSRADILSIIARGDNWGIIQCDKHAFRFFYPFELRALRPSKGS